MQTREEMDFLSWLTLVAPSKRITSDLEHTGNSDQIGTNFQISSETRRRGGKHIQCGLKHVLELIHSSLDKPTKLLSGSFSEIKSTHQNTSYSSVCRGLWNVCLGVFSSLGERERHWKLKQCS